MLKKVFAVLCIAFTILQTINMSIDIVKKISNRASNAVVYNEVKIY